MYIKKYTLKKLEIQQIGLKIFKNVILQSNKKLRHPVEGVWDIYKQTS